jgi:hypothetical protein
MYKLLPDNPLGPASCVMRIADNTYIPFDHANTDYQAFLAWKSEGNEPLPADEPQA